MDSRLCKSIMLKYNLNRDNIKRWIMVNHPDKRDHPEHDTRVSLTEYTTMLKCYRDKVFGKTKKPNGKNKAAQTKKKNANIFSRLRKLENFSKIRTYHKFDNSIFDREKLLADLGDASPKLMQLMNNIKELDRLDQEVHGRKFKHFIFSDVKEGGYGAKIIASAFMAFGYNNVIKVRKSRLYIDIQKSSLNFGLLCSTSIYRATFNEKIKKGLLTIFNERPGNIHGNNLRFIIFDSGFKEGIDLFDVKYVHIFEPSQTIADLKQTVGRATRTCGQKGLDFIPDVGWPLYVYNYYLTVHQLTADSFYMDNYKHDAGDDKKVLIFKNVEKMSDATMLYSSFDHGMNNLSKQLYRLGSAFSIDYYLTKNLHDVDDLNSEFMEKEYYLMGGAKKVFKNVNRQSRYYKIDLINCRGECGKRISNDIPVTVAFMERVYRKNKHPVKLIPKNAAKRKFFCDYMRNEENLFCQQINRLWAIRYAQIPGIVERNKKSAIKDKLEKLELQINNRDDDDETDKNYDMIEYRGTNIANSYNKAYYPLNPLNFLKMRDFIKTNYGKEYIWDRQKVVNKCIEVDRDQDQTREKPVHEFIELNPTQKFISKFFCPESPYKGILLWHSVGTGKTCTAVATASASFETAGYSILYVTRTTLKSGMWKNIFDQICHTRLRYELENGLILHKDQNRRKRQISNMWLEPMSYKQFSNLLLGKNTTYNILKERNGTTDILKKTLIIIDEAHKLYGGDLKAIERPNTDIMERLIMNSYKKSGNDSCKIMLMTATPFTNSPLELFSLVNMFYTDAADKITTDKTEFKKQYMNADNILSDAGVRNLANKLSGYISYLNREKDATQFAQPIMINVPVLMSHIKQDMRDFIFNKKSPKIDLTELLARLKSLKAHYKTTKKSQSKKKKEKKKKEKMTKKSKKNLEDLEDLEDGEQDLEDEDQDLDELKREIDELEREISTNKDLSANAKKQLREIKNSLIQEYILWKN